MSYKIDIHDSYIDFVAEANTPLSAQGTHCSTVLDCQARLNALVPLAEFKILYDVPNNHWDVRAQAVDGRVFGATMSYTAGETFYAFADTNVFSSIVLDAFVDLLEAWGRVLESHQFIYADTSWVQHG